MDKKEETSLWQIVLQSKRFSHAFRGLRVFAATTRHLLIHIGITILVLFLALHFRISSLEWIALVFAIGFVIVSEAFNTAIEIDIDLTSPEYHPYARDTKDVAAAAVFLSALTALVVGLVIFIPKIF